MNPVDVVLEVKDRVTQLITEASNSSGPSFEDLANFALGMASELLGGAGLDGETAGLGFNAKLTLEPAATPGSVGRILFGVSGISAFLGTGGDTPDPSDDVGVQLDGSLALMIETDGDVALDIGGNLELIGVDDVSLTGTAHLTLNTGADPVDIDVPVSATETIPLEVDALTTYPRVVISGALDAAGFAVAQGTFTITSLGYEPVKVKRANGTIEDQSPLLLTISGTDINLFAGNNGPYWTDLNDDDVQDANELNEDAVGLQLSHA